MVHSCEAYSRFRQMIVSDYDGTLIVYLLLTVRIAAGAVVLATNYHMA